MASKAKIIVQTDLTEPETAAGETEGLVPPTRERQIRMRAYEIFLQRGGQPGYELEDWLQAERALTSK